jgi:hypothetical protein
MIVNYSFGIILRLVSPISMSCSTLPCLSRRAAKYLLIDVALLNLPELRASLRFVAQLSRVLIDGLPGMSGVSRVKDKAVTGTLLWLVGYRRSLIGRGP